ncbi:MAG: prepilin-type N-terminal cleavage/methylation domain-containing protein [Patescibacteria group bacterium]
MRKKISPLKYNSGMTLVELLVVLAIFMIVAGLTIFDYGSFRSTVSTQNLVDDIALAVRKAQSYAIGARATESEFFNGYGVHFTTRKTNLQQGSADGEGRSLLGGSNKSFVLFTDIAGSGRQSAGGDRIYTYNDQDVISCGSRVRAGSECTELFSITGLDEIAAIYLNDEDRPIRDTAFVDVTFLRPNPDAYFCYKSTFTPAPPCERSHDISHIRIDVSNSQLSGGQNAIKTITIWNSGQISISSK